MNKFIPIKLEWMQENWIKEEKLWAKEKCKQSLYGNITYKVHTHIVCELLPFEWHSYANTVTLISSHFKWILSKQRTKENTIWIRTCVTSSGFWHMWLWTVEHKHSLVCFGGKFAISRNFIFRSEKDWLLNTLYSK